MNFFSSELFLYKFLNFKRKFVNLSDFNFGDFLLCKKVKIVK